MAARGSNQLHQAVIQDHYRRPRNRGALEAPATAGRAHNRFCGDTVLVWARVEDDRFVEVAFDGRGCVISQAAASMLTVIAKGKTVREIVRLRRRFVDGLEARDRSLAKELGDLRALVGVGRFPSRIRCAVLPFDALEDALKDD